MHIWVKNKKKYQKNFSENFHFYNQKKFCILHGRVFVMLNPYFSSSRKNERSAVSVSADAELMLDGPIGVRNNPSLFYDFR